MITIINEDITGVIYVVILIALAMLATGNFIRSATESRVSSSQRTLWWVYGLIFAILFFVAFFWIFNK